MADEKPPKEGPAKGWQPTFYDTVGLIIPGTWLLLGLFYLKQDLATPIMQGRNAFGIAELGLFLLLAFAVGHLVAALGNILEEVWWFPQGGRPTDWTSGQRILDSAARSRVGAKVKELHDSDFTGMEGMEVAKWRPLVRELYAHVAAAGRSGRIDVFNAQYGMMRGLAAASLALSLLAYLAPDHQREVVAIFAVAGLLSLYRMDRFARHYARELFAQFASLPKPKQPQGAHGSPNPPGGQTG